MLVIVISQNITNDISLVTTTTKMAATVMAMMREVVGIMKAKEGEKQNFISASGSMHLNNLNNKYENNNNNYSISSNTYKNV